MRLRFQFRRYRLPLRTPVRTAHGTLIEREGLVVRFEDESGRFGLGEAAPLPGFGTETADAAAAAAVGLGEWVGEELLAAVPESLPCLRNAIAAARAGWAAPGVPAAQASLGVAALLPAGRAALAAAGPRAEMGFRVFKWKVGLGDVADELSLLDDLCAVLPAGAKLRLDANGAWDRRRAERWLERCAERPVEFLEQPIAAGARGADDLLLGLAGDYPTPIALDESLGAGADVERWIGAGWPGVFVVKPSLLGDVAGALARLAAANAEVVFSSALETAIGARTALRAAFSWRGAGVEGADAPPPRALGFGVWPLFESGRFDGPAAAPFLRATEVEQINVEAVWNALN